jgi:hypothetical protein
MQRGDVHAVLFRARNPQAAHNAFHVGHRAARGIGELAALGGERHAAGVSLEQNYAEPCFKLAHVMADRAGSKVQLFGRVGEILVACGGFERREGR